MNIPLIVFLVAVFIIVDAFVIFYIIKKNRGDGSSHDFHFQKLSEFFGLAITGGDPVYPNVKWLSFIRKPQRVEGMHGGRKLQIYHYVVSSGKSSTTYTRSEIIVKNPKELTCAFFKEGVMSKIGKTFGMQDIQTGDTRFDELFIVKSSDEAFINCLLIDEIKQAFYDIWEKHKANGTIRLENDSLRYDVIGVIHTDEARERIIAVTGLLANLAEAIELYGG